ncbi:MAG: undecaprenyldiphospho-muramoylpentapeptide beta-N-acetylglucosaminyltransferase [Prevotellaceae bacterium]|jgi:UDP-N-acetylglucosamine--N-acetylmuramyl-(pentapeptide) pyrophosphoryl-undecaprenol N-acetylglucosamine transferase|nr:undecaprenyldiphospho-muramoylpentapeptide beta-N-acetylglucosaminyltransferase [Prevotellaceae bacterium]
MKFLISGGGTGGHIFPAVSIADALRKLQPDCEILFVGALGRMEMTRVPEAGHRIVGLPIQGFNRQQLWKNIRIPILLWKSIRQAKRIVRMFRPNAAIGVGGYASGAAMVAADMLNVPVLLQEQNSFAGITNRWLARKASRICVAYNGMERFFPAEKIVLTGNPIRQNLITDSEDRAKGFAHFDLFPQRKTLLVIGGSLGAHTINQSILAHLETLIQSEIQVIWQTGKNYIGKAREAVAPYDCQNIFITDFIDRMDYAYGVADLVISRAGASSISELCLLGKPAILVPSPNVAEDHQRHNAMALVNKEAALLVEDACAKDSLVPQALSLIRQEERLKTLSKNIYSLAEHNSAERIAQEVIALSKKYGTQK